MKIIKLRMNFEAAEREFGAYKEAEKKFLNAKRAYEAEKERLKTLTKEELLELIQ